MYRFVAIFLLALTVRVAAEPIAGDERLQFADGLYSRGMHDLASTEYKNYIRDFPDSPSGDAAHYRLGECYRQLQDPLAAQKEFGVVYTRYPESEFSARAGFKRASIFKDLEQYDGAIDLFKLVLKNNPPPDIAAASCFFLGECLIEKKQPQEARTALLDVVQKHKTSRFLEYALLKLGELSTDEARKKGEVEAVGQALDYLEQAQKAATTDRVRAEALFQIAEIHFRRGAFTESAAAYQDLLKKYPGDQRSAEARLQAAWAVHNAGLYADALSASEAALKDAVILEQHHEWLYLKANCERQLMRNDQAVATYAELLKRFPHSRFVGAARYEKALTRYRMGDYAAAIDLDGTSETAPELKKDVYWLLAQSHAALRQDDEAVQYYQLIAKDFPESDVAASATYRLAYHLQMRKDLKMASQHYREVATKWPKDALAPQALFASGLCLSQAGLHEEAVQDWAALTATYPDEELVEDALYQRAMEEVRLKRTQPAIASLESLLKRFPKTEFRADAYYWEGILYRESDKLAEAEDRLRRSLQSGPDTALEQEAKFYLAVVLHAQGKHAEAAEALQPLLSLPLRERLPAALLEWLTLHHLEKDLHGQAVEAARVLVEQNTETTWQQVGWGLMGRAHLAGGQTNEAAIAYAKALAADATTPLAAEAALRLGDISLGSGRFKPAEEHYKRASSLASDETMLGVRARAYVGLARTAKAVDNFDDAARYYMSVAILYEDKDMVPECLCEAAAIFRRNGDFTASDNAVRELKDRYPNSEWTRKALKEAATAEPPSEQRPPLEGEFGTPGRD